MKNIKNSIVLITLSCFVGQLLVGCNVGTQDITKVKSVNQAQQNINLNQVKSGNDSDVSFEDANKDDRLWANVIQKDGYNEDSSIYFTSSTQSNALIRLVGCEPSAKGVEVHLEKNLMFSSPMIDTPLALKAAGYPDMMPDPNYTSYTKFNDDLDNPNGKVLCHYSAYFAGVGDMYFDLETDYYRANSVVDLEQYFDYPFTSAQKEALASKWIPLIIKDFSHLNQIVAGLSMLIRQETVEKKAIEVKKEVTQAEQLQTVVNKVVDDEVWDTYKHIMGNIDDFTNEGQLESALEALEQLIEGTPMLKEAVITAENLLLLGCKELIYYGSKFRIQNIFTSHQGIATVTLKHESKQTLADAPLSKIKLEEEGDFPFKDIKPINIEQIAKKNNIDPKSISLQEKIMSKLQGEVSNQNIQDIRLAEQNNLAGFFAEETLSSIACSAIVLIAVWQAANYLVAFMTKQNQGNFTTTKSLFSITVPDQKTVDAWNKVHPPKDRIYANTKNLKVETNPNHSINRLLN